jgi:hypothetical protein
MSAYRFATEFWATCSECPNLELELQLSGRRETVGGVDEDKKVDYNWISCEGNKGVDQDDTRDARNRDG